MGWEMVTRGLVPVIMGAAVFFSGTAFGRDRNCVGVLRGVYPLGGEVRVEGVEAIAQARSAALESYSRGLTVQQQLKNPRAFGWVAVREETVVGYLVYERRGLHFEITNMAVLPGFERVGVGSELMEALVKKAGDTPGIEDVRVIVRSESQDVQDFFSAEGFQVAEKLSRHFDAQSTSGTLMKRSLAREAQPPERQLAVKPQAQRVPVAVQTIAISREALLKLDPTLQNAD